MPLHSPTWEKLQQALAVLRSRTDFVPAVGVVLGSGLGLFAEHIRLEASVDYADIDGFPVPTVSGHRGRFLFGFVGRVPVVLMQGRIHYYEGYDMAEAVMPVRLMGLLGVKTVLLTCMAGALNDRFAPGNFMVIRDHIASFVPSPLRGANADELGVRFPDMSGLYDPALQQLLLDTGRQLRLPMQQGVYVQVSGPQYESAAEVQLYRLLGGDAVGMSTAVEAIAARHMGLRVGGIACLSNMATGLCGTPLSHQEVLQAGDDAALPFAQLLKQSILKMEEHHD